MAEVVGLPGVTEGVGLAGSPPAENGCVQMISSVTEEKLSEVDNGVIISCRSLLSVIIYLLGTTWMLDGSPGSREAEAAHRFRVACSHTTSGHSK